MAAASAPHGGGRKQREEDKMLRARLLQEKEDLERTIMERRAAVADNEAFEAKSCAISNIGKPADHLNLNFAKLRNLKGHDGKIYDCHWSDDGTHLLSSAQDGHLIVWDCVTGDMVALVELASSWVMACAFAPQAMARRLVASGGLDNTCTIHDVTAAMDGESLDTTVTKAHVLQGHSGNLSHCRFVGNRGGIFTASGDGEIWQWDINAPSKPIAKFGGHEGDVTSFDFFPGSESHFVSSSIDGSCKIWDVRQKRPCISTLKGHGRNEPEFQYSNQLDVNKVVCHPAGDAFASCGADGTARLWSCRADQQIDQFYRSNLSNLREEGRDDDCQTLCFSKSGRLLFLSSNRRIPDGLASKPKDGPAIDDTLNTITHHDILTGDWTSDFAIQRRTCRSRVTSLGVSPGGECLVTGGFDGVVRLFGLNHKQSGPMHGP
mmetsp:Transcript_35555/g.107005  ORF Transcript_35555/g.107005 Transcript_35555/m.107005 type:complete len:434 (+) Transcript_35555:20-1321(+)